jgi:hypothetical protein
MMPLSRLLKSTVAGFRAVNTLDEETKSQMQHNSGESSIPSGIDPSYREAAPPSTPQEP